MCIMVPSAKRSTDVIPRDLVSFMERVLRGKEGEVPGLPAQCPRVYSCQCGPGWGAGIQSPLSWWVP